MRVLVLFLLICVGSINSYAQTPGNGQITLQYFNNKSPKERTEVGDENTPIKRSISQPVYASLYNKVVTVDFQAAFSAVTVNVINETTGETVYSELFINPASFSIDLSGKGTGDYMIEITSDEITLEGHFSL